MGFQLGAANETQSKFWNPLKLLGVSQRQSKRLIRARWWFDSTHSHQYSVSSSDVSSSESHLGVRIARTRNSDTKLGTQNSKLNLGW